MSKYAAWTMLLGASLALAACSGQKSDVQIPSPSPATPGQQPVKDPGLSPVPTNQNNGNQAGSPTASTANASISLNGNDFAKYGLTGLSYTFTYLTYTKTDNIQFTNNA